LLYIASTIFVLYLSVDKLDANVWNGLFWVIQLFICVNAVAKSFLQESRGRMLYFYSITSPVEFIIAKILYNLVLYKPIEIFKEIYTKLSFTIGTII